MILKIDYFLQYNSVDFIYIIFHCRRIILIYVRRNIKFVEFFINNNFDLFKLIDHLFDMRSIEFKLFCQF